MSNENESKRPSHIAYQVREGEENKSYFNRIGAAWTHKDGECRSAFKTRRILPATTARALAAMTSAARQTVPAGRIAKPARTVPVMSGEQA